MFAKLSYYSYETEQQCDKAIGHLCQKQMTQTYIEAQEGLLSSGNQGYFNKLRGGRCLLIIHDERRRKRTSFERDLACASMVFGSISV